MSTSTRSPIPEARFEGNCGETTRRATTDSRRRPAPGRPAAKRSALRLAPPLEYERLEHRQSQDRHVVVLVERCEAAGDDAHEQDEAKSQPDIQAEEDGREPNRFERS